MRIESLAEAQTALNGVANYLQRLEGLFKSIGLTADTPAMREVPPASPSQPRPATISAPPESSESPIPFVRLALAKATAPMTIKAIVALAMDLGFSKGDEKTTYRAISNCLFYMTRKNQVRKTTDGLYHLPQ